MSSSHLASYRTVRRESCSTFSASNQLGHGLEFRSLSLSRLLVLAALIAHKMRSSQKTSILDNNKSKQLAILPACCPLDSQKPPKLHKKDVYEHVIAAAAGAAAACPGASTLAGAPGTLAEAASLAGERHILGAACQVARPTAAVAAATVLVHLHAASYVEQRHRSNCTQRRDALVLQFNSRSSCTPG